MRRPSLGSLLVALFALTVGQASAQVPSSEDPAPGAALPVIVALGDSVTAGYGLQPRHKFPTLLQQRLADEGYPHQVVNAGRNGDTTSGALRRLDRALVPNTQILIVALGGNDRRLGTDAKLIESNLTEIVEHAQARGVKVLLCDMGTGLDAMLTRLTYKYPGHVTKALSVMADVRSDPHLAQADGHPNAAGSATIAAAIWPYLQPLLTK
jgi:acyl-CoA thioesterase-1